MAIRFSTPSLSVLFGLPIVIGSLALSAGCTFEPPGSVLGKDNGNGNGNGNSVDAGGGGGAVDAAPMGAPETMTIGFTTTPRGIGPYTPKNIVAAWIESPDGTFITTIYRHSAVRTSSLKAWNAVAPIPPVDVTSGATRNTHNTPISATWTIPSEVPDGDYTVRVETSEVNANTPADNAQASFVFSKNGTAVSLTPAEANYDNVTLVYSGR